jgi:hypothetical protein
LKTKLYIVLLIIAVAASGCRLIDDDLTVCGSSYLIDYEMRLVTEVHMTIEERLSLEVEKHIADTLKRWSDPYFSGHAHDLDMCFYSLDGTDELQHHKNDIINATQKSYTLYIPRQDYRHLAVVNIQENNQLSYSIGTTSTASHITQRTGDTIPSHETAVYTARELMYMSELDEEDKTFEVKLYMASCAVAFVITNTTSAKPKIQRVVVGGTASGFVLRDSIYTFDTHSFIRAERITDECYAVLTLPSRDSITASKAPARDAQTAPTPLWEARVYTLRPDGKTVETVFSFSDPLRAGTMEIVKMQIQDDGSVVAVENPEVGVSVTLDWGEGNDHEIEI